MKTLRILLFVLGGLIAGFAAEPPKPELPKTGVNLARDEGGWINVTLVQTRFVVSFFNEKKEPVAADVHHGLVRYVYVARESGRTPLTRSTDGKKLVSPFEVQAPHIFRVYLALFNENPDDLAETFAFFYGGK